MCLVKIWGSNPPSAKVEQRTQRTDQTQKPALRTHGRGPSIAKWCNESRQAMENLPTSTTTANLAPQTHFRWKEGGAHRRNSSGWPQTIYAVRASFITAKLSGCLRPISRVDIARISTLPAASPSTESRLEELLSMKEKRLISQEEYDTLRKKALGL